MVSVKEMMDKYSVLAVHGFLGKEAGQHMPKQFNFAGRDMDWHEKLEVLVKNAPTISASTVQEGDTYHNYWSPIGVILNDGVIEFASHLDISSTAVNNNTRLPSVLCLPQEFRGMSSYELTKPVEEQVEAAITRRWSGYNELVIRNPKIAGFYMLPEIYSSGRIDMKNIEVQEISEKLDELGMPFFTMHKGKVYEAKYNPRSNWIDFSIKKPITREGIKNREYELPAEKAKAA